MGLKPLDKLDSTNTPHLPGGVFVLESPIAPSWRKMNALELKNLVGDVVTTLHCAYAILSPSFLRTTHQLAVDSMPPHQRIKIPFDTPVVDVLTGAKIKPSEIQKRLLSSVIPSMLAAIQSLAEDELNGLYGNASAFKHIETAVKLAKIDRAFASKAHFVPVHPFPYQRRQLCLLRYLMIPRSK